MKMNEKGMEMVPFLLSFTFFVVLVVVVFYLHYDCVDFSFILDCKHNTLKLEHKLLIPIQQQSLAIHILIRNYRVLKVE